MTEGVMADCQTSLLLK